MSYYKSLAVCSQLSHQYNEFHCNLQLKYINTKLNKIQNDFAIIAHQIPIRNKRSLLNFVGDGLKWLFGTPDANDAQFYTDSINSIINDQKQTELLMQQVRIIPSTILNFNNSLQTLNRNTRILNDNIKKSDEFMTQTTRNQQQIHIESLVMEDSIVITVIEVTDEAQNMISNYVDSLSLLTKGIISYNTLNPKDLFLELKKNKY